MYSTRAPPALARPAALCCSESAPWANQPPPSGIRPNFFTSRWTMWPGSGGSDLARRPQGFTVDVAPVQAVQPDPAQDPRHGATAIVTSSVASSRTVRRADCFFFHNTMSGSTTCCGVAFRLLEASSSPGSPCSRYRRTHLLRHGRDTAASAATWAIGRCCQRRTRRSRPSGVKGAFAWVMRQVPSADST